VPFRVVEHSPSWANANEAISSDPFHHARKIGGFEEYDSFIERRVGFCTLSFHAKKRSIAIELGVVPDFLVRDFQAERVAVKPFRRIKVIEIKFNSHQSQLGLWHNSSVPLHRRLS
jgi:hypothetical protein